MLWKFCPALISSVLGLSSNALEIRCDHSMQAAELSPRILIFVFESINSIQYPLVVMDSKPRNRYHIDQDCAMSGRGRATAIDFDGSGDRRVASKDKEEPLHERETAECVKARNAFCILIRPLASSIPDKFFGRKTKTRRRRIHRFSGILWRRGAINRYQSIGYAQSLMPSRITNKDKGGVRDSPSMCRRHRSA